MNGNGLQNFIEWSLDHGYNETLTIDRINSSGNYSPDNCQWVTASENSYRTTSNITESPTLRTGFTYENNDQIVIEIKRTSVLKMPKKFYQLWDMN